MNQKQEDTGSHDGMDKVSAEGDEDRSAELVDYAGPLHEQQMPGFMWPFPILLCSLASSLRKMGMIPVFCTEMTN